MTLDETLEAFLHEMNEFTNALALIGNHGITNQRRYVEDFVRFTIYDLDTKYEGKKFVYLQRDEIWKIKDLNEYRELITTNMVHHPVEESIKDVFDLLGRR